MPAAAASGWNGLGVQAASDPTKRVACSSLSGDAATYGGRNLDRATKANPACLHCLQRLAGAHGDDSPFPLGNGTCDVGEQLSVRRGHVHIDVESDESPTATPSSIGE